MATPKKNTSTESATDAPEGGTQPGTESKDDQPGAGSDAAVANPVTVECPEWSETLNVVELSAEEAMKLRGVLGVSPNITKKPGGLNAAFLAFVTTDAKGKRVFKTDEESILRLRNKHPVVLARLTAAAQGLNGALFTELTAQFKPESVYAPTDKRADS